MGVLDMCGGYGCHQLQEQAIEKKLLTNQAQGFYWRTNAPVMTVRAKGSEVHIPQYSSSMQLG